MSNSNGAFKPAIVAGFTPLDAGALVTADLLAAPNAWVSVGQKLNLPGAGDYLFDAVGLVRAVYPNVTSFNVALRLFDETANAVVPNSESQSITHFVNVQALGTFQDDEQRSSPIHVRYAAPGANVIRLEAKYQLVSGPAPSLVQLRSSPTGHSTLRYTKAL